MDATGVHTQCLILGKFTSGSCICASRSELLLVSNIYGWVKFLYKQGLFYLAVVMSFSRHVNFKMISLLHDVPWL